MSDLILYRYLRTHFVESLLNNELKVARMGELNDPFEGQVAFSGEIDEQRAYAFVDRRRKEPTSRIDAHLRSQHPWAKSTKAVDRLFQKHRGTFALNYLNSFPQLKKQASDINRDALEKHLRVICFSANADRPPDDVLMWAHYTGMHIGARIGYKIPEELSDAVRKVTYKDKRTVVDLAENSTEAEITEQLKGYMATKSKSWSYENEYRMLIDPSLCHKRVVGGREFEFLGISSARAVTLDFGFLTPPDEVKAGAEKVRAEHPHIQIRQARPHGLTYSFEYVDVP